MMSLFCLIVGSSLLGAAAGDWKVGCGVALIAMYLFPSN